MFVVAYNIPFLAIFTVFSYFGTWKAAKNLMFN